MKALVSTGRRMGMNKSQLVNTVAEQANLTKSEARIAVNVVLDELSKAPAKKAPGKKAPAKKAPAKKAPAKKAPAKKAPAKKAPAAGAKFTTRSAFVSVAKIDTRGQTPPATGAGQP
jgi:hypothetical protein